jgi:hypothetical protein
LNLSTLNYTAMRQSDELEEIFRKYWDQMSDRTKSLAKRSITSLREVDKSKESGNHFFVSSDDLKEMRTQKEMN